MARIHQDITVDVPREDAYELWSRVELLPCFLRHLTSAVPLGDELVCFTTEIGRRRQFVARVRQHRPGHVIRWSCAEEPSHQGEITFVQVSRRPRRLHDPLGPCPHVRNLRIALPSRSAQRSGGSPGIQAPGGGKPSRRGPAPPVPPPEEQGIPRSGLKDPAWPESGVHSPHHTGNRRDPGRRSAADPHVEGRVPERAMPPPSSLPGRRRRHQPLLQRVSRARAPGGPDARGACSRGTPWDTHRVPAAPAPGDSRSRPGRSG